MSNVRQIWYQEVFGVAYHDSRIRYAKFTFRDPGLNRRKRSLNRLGRGGYEVFIMVVPDDEKKKCCGNE